MYNRKIITKIMDYFSSTVNLKLFKYLVLEKIFTRVNTLLHFMRIQFERGKI
jgi:hypothetical protein